MTTRTLLVHRVSSRDVPWWRDAVVYELPSTSLSAADLRDALALLDHAVSLGMTAVTVRPSQIDVDPAGSTTAEDLEAFATFVEQAHERGLRVITRISGALGPVTGAHAGENRDFLTGREVAGPALLERAESFLERGADGIDLGMVVPPDVAPETDLDLLSEYLRLLRGRVALEADEGILAVEVSVEHPRQMLHHIQEDWLHHLRDDALTLAQWDAQSIRRQIVASLSERDRFAVSPVWRFLPSIPFSELSNPGHGSEWFNVDAEQRRARSLAFQALILALPGVVYIREGDEVAMLDEDKPTAQSELNDRVFELSGQQADLFGSPLATLRHATYIRAERGLASAPLALVDGLEWCPPQALTLLLRDVLVLVNVTNESIRLPGLASIILSTAQLGRREGRLVVPPGATVWLEASTVR